MIFLAVFFFSLTSNALNIAPYVTMNNFLTDLYKNNLAPDNNYFSSQIILTTKVPELPKDLTKQEQIDAIKEVLLTKFAYARVSEDEKEKLAQIIFTKASELKLSLYKVPSDFLSGSLPLHISPSAQVYTPDHVIILADKSQPISFYRIVSDIWD